LTSTRALAVDALVRIEDGAFSHLVVPELVGRSRLAPRDRAFVTALVYGTLRMQRVLDDALVPCSNRSLDSLDPAVRAALRLGAYQLFDGVAPHAAVGETVAAVAPRARGFANGVLRALARGPLRWPVVDGATPDAELGARLSHPDWLVQLLLDQFGRDDTVAMLELDNRPAPVTLRPNRLRTTGDALAAELAGAGVHATRGELVDDALVLTAGGDVTRLGAVLEGRATPQDQASQAVIAVLDPRSGERVADVAAAPGGKATAAAEAMRDRGLVVAADLHAGRLARVREASTRLALRAVKPVVADAAHPALRASAFDRVLLDAPCTGLGVLRRRPEARWRITAADIDTLARRQRELLAAAPPLVRPGGRLVYSVCTVSDAETVGIDAWARDAPALAGFVAIPPPGPPWRPHGRGALLLPNDAGTDGMFVLALQAPG
jgi:16S rRNA (cytosine967-C5)-methyltransferase